MVWAKTSFKPARSQELIPKCKLIRSKEGKAEQSNAWTDLYSESTVPIALEIVSPVAPKIPFNGSSTFRALRCILY